MKTLRATQMLAGVLVLTVALALGVQRQAQAGDTGKILAAVAAAVIIYEVLDDDGNGRHKHKCTRQCSRKCSQKQQRQRYNQRQRDYRHDVDYSPVPRQTGYNVPLPGQRYDDRYYGNNQYNDHYYENRRNGRLETRYQKPGRYAGVEIRKNRRGTSVDIEYRDRDRRYR
ncbi:MAG TPA: hypothetical protein QGH10_18490 [Armatimonadota bacterium]|nr:hypothetical protein [Armatimonadota bacterium]